ncbi:MAG: hypothetical protein MJ238_05880 [Bacilli bacterium]|nr:hypothetical protein [Bacilli bacterium]
MKKTKLLGLGLVSMAMLASCGANGGAKEAKLVECYISDARLSYSNMRPTYNYYLTTFDFQVLEVYDNNTYCLTLSSSQYSALILPEEGNDIQGNERSNSLWKYYGNIEKSEADELDENTKFYYLEKANRIVGSSDEGYYVDTANWTDEMKAKSADKKMEYNAETGQQTVVGTTEYTADEYLEAKNIKDFKMEVNVETVKLVYNNKIR